MERGSWVWDERTEQLVERRSAAELAADCAAREAQDAREAAAWAAQRGGVVQG